MRGSLLLKSTRSVHKGKRGEIKFGRHTHLRIVVATANQRKLRGSTTTTVAQCANVTNNMQPLFIESFELARW